MTIYQYADIIGKKLIITYYPKQDGAIFTILFDGASIKENEDSSIISGIYGNGVSIEHAISIYIQKIKNKYLIFNAYNAKDKQEFLVPHFIQ